MCSTRVSKRLLWWESRTPDMAKKRKQNGVAADAEAPATATMKETIESTEKPETKKETLNEIDEIFAKTKKTKTRDSKPAKNISPDRHKDENEHDVKGSNEVNDNVKKKKKTKKLDGEEWRDPPTRPRRKTNDGFTVYSAEELGFNKKDAGGTSLCPFDCDCCF